MMYKGIRIIANSEIKKRVQARKHRKKRINKKWLKRYGYKLVPDPSHIYVVNIPGQGKTMFCHPKLYDKLVCKIMEMEGVR